MFKVKFDLLSEILVADAFAVTKQDALKSVPSVVDAVMVAVPDDTAVTTPFWLIVATLLLLDCHKTSV